MRRQIPHRHKCRCPLCRVAMEYSVPVKEVLEKLGMALYLHKELIKCAQKGKEAVEYFEGHGLLVNSRERK